MRGPVMNSLGDIKLVTPDTDTGRWFVALRCCGPYSTAYQSAKPRIGAQGVCRSGAVPLCGRGCARSRRRSTFALEPFTLNPKLVFAGIVLGVSGGLLLVERILLAPREKTSR